VANRDQVESAIGDILATFSTGETMRRLDAAGVAYGQMTDAARLFSHPVLVGRDRVRRISTDRGSIDALLPPATLGGAEPALGDVPALGAQGPAILHELGYDDAAVADLSRAGVVRTESGV